MILNKNAGSIADWWFEGERKSVSKTNRFERNQLLNLCQLTIDILEAHELLQPSTVLFENWFSYDFKTKTVYRVEKPNLTITLSKKSGEESFLASCQDTLDRLPGFLYPGNIKIFGTGIVLDAEGIKYELENVVWIWGTTGYGHTVDIITQSDVWLPCTLLGQPQPEVYRLNAPRLQKALQEIQKALGVEPIIDDVSDFAIIKDNFLLDNIVDIEGDVIPINFKAWNLDPDSQQIYF